MHDLLTQDLRFWVPTFIFVLLWALMQWYEKLPSMQSIQDFVALVNSRGGNIVILAGGSIYFFKWSMFLFMKLLNMVKDGTIKQDNAFALMAIQFVTTAAFGGVAGALLKTMTGESSRARTSDNDNSNVTSSVKRAIRTKETSETEIVTPPAKEIVVPPLVPETPTS